MKRMWIVMILLVFVTTAILGTSIVTADKPPHAGEDNQSIQRPNGFPAGTHFNLNIHGKKAGFTCNETAGGGSIFIDEYGPATIEYVTNKKASVTELVVLDPCAINNGKATVQLPYEREGYHVYGRILGKPNNGNLDPVSSIILYPNEVVSACNDVDPANPDFPSYTECPDDPLLALGLIVGPNTYTAEPEEYVRFETGVTKGKGKSKATDITRLFTFTGWVVDARLDTNRPADDSVPDGVIDVWDIPVDDYDGDSLTPSNRDYNNDGVIDDKDIEAWLNDMAALASPMAWYYEEEWVLNIADLVITEQGLVNDGTKLLQIRFYPVSETTFDQ